MGIDMPLAPADSPGPSSHGAAGGGESFPAALDTRNPGDDVNSGALSTTAENQAAQWMATVAAQVQRELNDPTAVHDYSAEVQNLDGQDPATVAAFQGIMQSVKERRIQ